MKPFPEKATYEDKYDPAISIQSQAEADEYFEMLVVHSMGAGKSREEAEGIERYNLGYWAGYYDNETRERVERLFKCAHPLFGAIAEKGPPTPEEAFQLGVELGKKSRRQT